jgi:hypothetical protein
MAQQPYDAVVPVSHNQFQLNDLGVVPDLETETGGLLDLLTGGVRVRCGISDGPVRLRAETFPTAPPQDTGTWDEVAEISFVAPVGSVRVTPLFQWPVAEIPPLTPGPGTYRVRVHARGQDAARNRFVASPTEDYLLQIWPVTGPEGTA